MRSATQGNALLAVLQADRKVVIVGLLAITALAWLYTAYLGNSMSGSGSMEMGQKMAGTITASWSLADFAATLMMWVVMMVAMMVPTAAPMVLTFTSMIRRKSQSGSTSVPTAIFVTGYIVIWSGFALGATLIQWGLHEATLRSPMMVTTNTVLGSALLIGAGAYQLSPLKLTCLNKCRSPLGFLMNEWREGHRGTLSMGLVHGAYCVGCCWMLMALLFVLGVMNLLWIAVLSAFVLLEKVVPAGQWLSRASGILLIAWGAWLPFVT